MGQYNDGQFAFTFIILAKRHNGFVVNFILAERLNRYVVNIIMAKTHSIL